MEGALQESRPDRVDLSDGLRFACLPDWTCVRARRRQQEAEELEAEGEEGIMMGEVSQKSFPFKFFL